MQSYWLSEGDRKVTVDLPGYVPVEDLALRGERPGPVQLKIDLKRAPDERPASERRQVRIALKWNVKSNNADRLYSEINCPCQRGRISSRSLQNKPHDVVLGHSIAVESNGSGQEALTLTDPLPGKYEYSVYPRRDSRGRSDLDIEDAGTVVRVTIDDRVEEFRVPEGLGPREWRPFKRPVVDEHGGAHVVRFTEQEIAEQVAAEVQKRNDGVGLMLVIMLGVPLFVFLVSQSEFSS